MGYSIKLGLWKTVKNFVIVAGPAILAFMAALPEDVVIKYALPLGLLSYFIKNLIENWNAK